MIDCFLLKGLLICSQYLRRQEKTYSSQPQEIKKDVAPLSKILLICGLALAFAIFIINMLVTELGKSVDSAILFSVSNAISIIITILVGAIYYKEKITLKNIVGILLCVGALGIINFL